MSEVTEEINVKRDGTKKLIALDRQSSSVSTLSGVSSWADLSAAYSTSTSNTNLVDDVASLTSILNFALGMLIFWLGVWHTHLFVPPHDHVFDRPHPYQTISTGDVIVNFELNHALIHPASVPSKLLWRTCVWLPILVILLVHSRSSWNCTLGSLSGLCAGVGICEVSTHILKHYVLRRRPNFYALCEWDGMQCTGSRERILESQLSFPSGHSSISWCGMTFLVLVLLGKMKLSQPTGRLWKQWTTWLVCVIPLSWAAYVAASRIADKWHHASDVVAGVMIGVACATVSYHSNFPHVLSLQAGTSYAEQMNQKNK